MRPAGRPAVRSYVRRAFDAKSLAANESSDPESVSPSTPLTQRPRTSLIKAKTRNISNIDLSSSGVSCILKVSGSTVSRHISHSILDEVRHSTVISIRLT